MASGAETIKDYYDHYAQGGWDLQTMHEILRDHPDTLPQQTAVALHDLDRANYLVLGSAVPRNIDNMALIGRTLRPGQGDKDVVTIVDLNDYTLRNHQRHSKSIVEWHRDMTTPREERPLLYPQYMLSQGDMRALPVASDSVDVAFSDYTFNFLSSTEDVATAFGEVARTLKDHGSFVIALCGHSKYPYGASVEPLNEPQAEQRQMVGATLQKFPLDTYIQLADQQGLELAQEPWTSSETKIICAALQPKSST